MVGRSLKSFAVREKLYFFAFILALLTLVSSRSVSQAVPAYPGSVEGRVICNDGGFPARHAHVSLMRIEPLLDPKGGSKSPAFDSNTRTDFDGKYAIPGVPAGEYLVWVHQAGYIDEVGIANESLKLLSPDKRKEFLASLPQVMVRNGRSHADIVVRKGGAISGRVTFPDGGALNGAHMGIVMVSDASIGDSGPGRVHETSLISSRFGESTDDRGFYRIAGLPKGKYRISMRDDEVQVFAPDATRESDAKLISVDEGDEVSDVNITIPSQLFHSISGIVTRDGVPIAHASVTISRQGERATYEGSETKTGGLYRFQMQLSGNYVLEARYPVEPPQIATKITVQVGDGDVLDANIDLRSR